MKMLRNQFNAIFNINPLVSTMNNRFFVRNLVSGRCVSNVCRDEAEMRDLMNYLESLKNYEKSGVPKGAGTDSDDGFDLDRMRRLMHHLGNPQSSFKAVHVAGTKGKGSTAAFVANILRAGGHSVGCYSSPHILSIRERMSVGRLNEPIGAETLNSFFHAIKPIIDRAVEEEKGCLSHFEVLTGLAFALFANENVEVAVIEAGLGGARDATNIIDCSGLAASVITTIGEEHMAALGGSLESIAVAKSGIIKHRRPVILGGPFPSEIEKLLLDKASLMASPVLLTSDGGVDIINKGVSVYNDRLCQSCDIVFKIERDVKLDMELTDIKLRMLGHHQLQNAATAACVALILRNQGWKLDGEAIRAGLENTSLIGRSQFLTSKEAEAMGLSGAMILLDGAHTKESARALKDMLKTTFPEKKLAIVVAMADDKDHMAFARELLSGRQPEVVILTEADIAGGNSRTTSMSLLTDSWTKALAESGINTKALGNGDFEIFSSQIKDATVLAAESLPQAALRLADRVLRERTEKDDDPGIIVVTGSLHIVSSVLVSSLDS